MSQTSRGTNKGPKQRPTTAVQAAANKQPTGFSRIGPAQSTSNFVINNYVGPNVHLNSPRPRLQQPQQLFSNNIITNGPFFNVGNSSASQQGSNRLTTLANVSVAAAAAANSTNNFNRNHHLPIANAPTSLANLARLGGVTLLPIGGTNDGSGSLSNLAIELDTYNQSQLDAPESSGINKNHFISISNAQGPMSSISAGVHNKSNKSALPDQLQRHLQKQSPAPTNHDLDSVSSVRLLNQASGIDAANLWILTGTVGDNNAFTGARNRPHVSTLPASTTTVTTVNNSRKTKKAPRNNDVIPTQPVGIVNQSFAAPSGSNTSNQSSFSNFLNSFATQQQQYNVDNDVNTHIHNASMSRSSESYCNDLELNNNSLMKLMAILNNPALTITAVNNPASATTNANSNLTIDRSGPNNQLPAFPLNLPSNQQSKSNRRLDLNERPSQTQSQCKSRMPKSAANLQLLLKSQSSLPSSYESRQPQINSSQANLGKLNSNPSLNTSTSLNSDQSHLSWSNNKPATIQHNGSFPGQIGLQNPQLSPGLPAKNYSSSMTEDVAYHHSSNEINARPNQQPTVSVQLLRHIANQAHDDESEWMIEHDPDAVGRAVLEPECIITNIRSLLPFTKEAKCIDKRPDVVANSSRKRRSKTILTTNMKRLCVATKVDSSWNDPTSSETDPLEDMQISIIERAQSRERYISEQHQILSSLSVESTSNKTTSKSSCAIPEPDEIFINRPKKVMSKIDTMLEKKKRKRFERISGRSAPKTTSLEEQCEESEAEWSGDEKERYDDICLFPVQLPLDDQKLTYEKANYVESLGLVSRYDRQKLSLRQVEKEMSQITPLAYREPSEASTDILRMVDTVLKTDGTDIQMRVDSNIKRNDLPLIEGLSRNTSRVKMSYMNILGLEKRSKRTTLYKLKNSDNQASSATTPKQQQDLTNQPIVPSADQRSVLYGLYMRKPSENSISTFGDPRNQKTERAPCHTDTKQIAHLQQNQQQQQKLKLYLNCRDVVKPSKDEYMKSLGLMAS